MQQAFKFVELLSNSFKVYLLVNWYFPKQVYAEGNADNEEPLS